MAWFEKFANKVNEKMRETEEEVEFRDFEDVVNERGAKEEEPEDAAPAESLSASSDAGGNINLKFARPESYNDDDVSEIAEYLLDGYIVVLDVEAMSRGDVIRMLDFLNGVTYVTEGTITQRNQKTFVITPSNVNITD